MILYSGKSIRWGGISVLLLLASCWHHTKPASKQHNKANIDYAALFGRLQGTWISYEYMLNLNKTGSPYHSAAFMEGIFSFTIDSNHLQNDTLHCRSWINGHEVRDLWIAFTSRDSSGLYGIGINNSDNDLHNPATDNITSIKIDSPFLTIYTNSYDSVRYAFYGHLPRFAGADYPLRHYTTDALFSGAYSIMDSTRLFRSGRVYFDPKKTGRIYGSDVYDSFDINVDVLAQTDSMDYMELFDSKKKNESRSFIYSIQNNVIRIYAKPDSIPCVLYKVVPEDTFPRH
jgi:hypothetical protein